MNTRNFQLDTQFTFGTSLFSKDEVVYNIQNVQLPGIDMTPVEVRNQGALMFVNGDDISYQELSVSFILDEKMEVWKSIVKKIFETVNTTESTYQSTSADSWLLIKAADGSEVLKVSFSACHVVNVGTVNYDTQGESDVITFDVTFQYDYFEVV